MGKVQSHDLCLSMDTGSTSPKREEKRLQKFLCEVSSSSRVTRLGSLLAKVRPEIVEAATEGGSQVATPAFHPFLVAAS